MNTLTTAVAFEVNGHHALYDYADSWLQPAYRFSGYCDDCHSPDENGEGRVDFFAATEGDFFEQFLAHAYQTEV